MEQLITSEDIRALIPRITPNLKDASLVNQCIINAQRFDLRPLIGDAFYLELYTNVNTSPIPEKFDDLWNGTTYQSIYNNNLTIEFYGMKDALINYSVVRILRQLNVHFTRAGVKVKDTDTSTTSSQGEKSSYINTFKSQAIAYMEDVNKYLCQFEDDFPTWKLDCQERTGQSVRHLPSEKNSTNLKYPYIYTSKKYY